MIIHSNVRGYFHGWLMMMVRHHGFSEKILMEMMMEIILN
jgi:hypothetical protein